MIREFLENYHGGLTMCIELWNEDRMELMTLDTGGAVHVMATRILNGAPSASGYRSDERTHAAALRAELQHALGALPEAVRLRACNAALRDDGLKLLG